jgi:hypothetical protein
VVTWRAWRASGQVQDRADTASPRGSNSGLKRTFPFPKGANMSAAAVRILVVGTSTASTESTLKGLARSGWASHAVTTVREADTVLRTIRFQLTLAAEKLPDGTGYDLAWLVAQQTGNLFIAVPLSETCLWLPAVENGVRSLGERALNPLMLKTEAESILRTCDTAIVGSESERSRRRSSSGEVVRAAVLPSGGVAQIATAERIGRQANERFERGEVLASRGPSVADEQVLALPRKVPSHSSRLLHESVGRDFGSLGKRWRGL